MAKSIRDQLLDSGRVTKKEPRTANVEGRRATVEEKSLPPPFEAPARGVFASSTVQERAAVLCEDCGAKLPAQRVAARLARCAECAADQR